jgi:acetylornithine deacetylase/succinyl-diaminopimelate desuccinylase-like protein
MSSKLISRGYKPWTRSDIIATSTGDASAGYPPPAELLQKLIRFDTTNPPGNERACIEYIDDLLTGHGFETTILARDKTRPNLVTRLPGRGEAPPLLLYGHLDVVSTENQPWTYPPFEGRIVDGCVWGRGALDMKGPVAIMLSTLVRARAESLAPAGDVLLVLMADEEVKGAYGAHYLVQHHAGIFDGVHYAIGEAGGFTAHLGDRRFYPIMVAEKQCCALRATVRGQGGHGAMPVRRQATARLGRLLRRLDRKRLPVHITPATRQMIEGIATALPARQRLVLRQLLNPWLTDRLLDLMGPVGAALDPLLHNTVSPTMLRGSSQLNVIPAEVSVNLDGRLLPGYGPDDMLAELRRLLGSEVELEVYDYEPGPPEPDMGLFDLLADILREADPGSHPVPLLMTGATDARHLARLGIQTYGFTPLKMPPGLDFWQRLHAADERVPVAALDFGVEALYRLLERYGPVA